jgi:uncharacterized protein (TIGR02391 family)
MAAADAQVRARRALAATQAMKADLDSSVIAARPETESPHREPTFDDIVIDEELIKVSRTLFLDGHYALAVLEAFKCLNNFVKLSSGASDKDGAKLMNHAFSVSNPVLALNSLKSASERDEQIGYTQIFSGVMTGIRNPRAHEHGFIDDPLTALELLGLGNHLMQVARRAELVAE